MFFLRELPHSSRGATAFELRRELRDLVCRPTEFDFAKVLLSIFCGAVRSVGGSIPPYVRHEVGETLHAQGISGSGGASGACAVAMRGPDTKQNCVRRRP